MVSVHRGASRPTLAGEIACSPAWKWVSSMFCPAIGHCPGVPPGCPGAPAGPVRAVAPVAPAASSAAVAAITAATRPLVTLSILKHITLGLLCRDESFPGLATLAIFASKPVNGHHRIPVIQARRLSRAKLVHSR